MPGSPDNSNQEKPTRVTAVTSDGSTLDLSSPGSRAALADVLYKGVLRRLVASYKEAGEELPPKAKASAEKLGLL